MTFLEDSPPLPPLSALFPHTHSDPSTFPASTDPFTITTTTGFLPARPPLTTLPAPFTPLNDILDRMPIVLGDGKPGLLASFDLGPLIDDGKLPDLTDAIDDLKTTDGQWDLEAITAAFRDYSFLASAYLLEPCWEKWSKDHDGGYGLGRDKLPRCIAGPLVKTADILDIPPFMSYAASYALYNYSLVNPSAGPSVYSNLRLIRAFEQGLNPTSSEAGFILTHIHMVQATGPLIAGALELLDVVENRPGEYDAAVTALQTMLTAMTTIEANMEAMWHQSLPKDYIAYRTFIFGITNQSMFPTGVRYLGTRHGDDRPLFFRGESGANDSIIPLLDHLCEIPMPANPLTEILRDFRNYRPRPHREFLAWVLSKAAELGVRAYCTQAAGASDHNETGTNTDTDAGTGAGVEAGVEAGAGAGAGASSGSPAAALLPVLYLRLLEHVRSFRWRHWLFAREYIIKRSAHPTATGGSPIVTWLPNQLFAVMELMERVYAESGLRDKLARGDETVEGGALVAQIMDTVGDAYGKLDKEVRKYCSERGV